MDAYRQTRVPRQPQKLAYGGITNGTRTAPSSRNKRVATCTPTSVRHTRRQVGDVRARLHSFTNSTHGDRHPQTDPLKVQRRHHARRQTVAFAQRLHLQTNLIVVADHRDLRRHLAGEVECTLRYEGDRYPH